MSHADYCYAEVCPNLHTRGSVREVPDIADLYGSKPVECYTSVYRFSADVQAYVAETKSISGYTGASRATGLHFDMDYAEGELVLKETRQLFEAVCSDDRFGINCDDVKVWFSGNKGFHVLIANKETLEREPSTDTPATIKAVCTMIAGHYVSFDRSVYDTQRIFRAPNSKHMKSRLFKIPLYGQELWDLAFEDIRELARNQRCLTDDETIKTYLEGKGWNGNI